MSRWYPGDNSNPYRPFLEGRGDRRTEEVVPGGGFRTGEGRRSWGWRVDPILRPPPKSAPDTDHPPKGSRPSFVLTQPRSKEPTSITTDLLVGVGRSNSGSGGVRDTKTRHPTSGSPHRTVSPSGLPVVGTVPTPYRSESGFVPTTVRDCPSPRRSRPVPSWAPFFLRPRWSLPRLDGDRELPGPDPRTENRPIPLGRGRLPRSPPSPTFHPSTVETTMSE